MKQNQNCRDSYSLRENIAQAKSIAEIKTDLKFGETLTEASPRTRRAWLATAARRAAQLGASL